MSLAWHAALRNAALMLVIYVGLDLLAIRLGWLHRVGWPGAVIAMVFVGWASYARTQKAPIASPPPNDR